MDRSKDPHAVPLTLQDIRTASFPDGNCGWGVRVSAGPPYTLTPCAPPASWRGRKPDLPPPAFLPDVVVSLVEHEGWDGPRWKVEGYWNLAGAWRLRASDDWPFGGHVYHPAPEGPLPAGGPRLVCCLPDGRLYAPRIPSFAEAEAWILNQHLQAPPWKCGCGALHSEGGRVVGLEIERTPGLEDLPSIRLLYIDSHGRSGHALPETVLGLQACCLLHYVR